MNFDVNGSILAFYHYMKTSVPSKPGQGMETLAGFALLVAFVIGFCVFCWMLPEKLKARLALPALSISMYSLVLIVIGAGLALFDVIGSKVVFFFFILWFLSSFAWAIFGDKNGDPKK